MDVDVGFTFVSIWRYPWIFIQLLLWNSLAKTEQTENIFKKFLSDVNRSYCFYLKHAACF